MFAGPLLPRRSPQGEGGCGPRAAVHVILLAKVQLARLKRMPPQCVLRFSVRRIRKDADRVSKVLDLRKHLVRWSADVKRLND